MVRTLVTGPATATLFAPVTLPGDYALYVSVGLRDGTPRLALPLAGDDGQHRYKLGQVVLRKKGG